MTEQARQRSMTKRQVSIRIESVSGGDRIVQEASGVLYPKGDHVYLRYAETEGELGETQTTIRLDGKEIRIVRSGDIRSEQRFSVGTPFRGYYATPQGRLELEIVTKSLRTELPVSGSGELKAVWSYELLVGGDLAGMYRLKLEAR